MSVPQKPWENMGNTPTPLQNPYNHNHTTINRTTRPTGIGRNALYSYASQPSGYMPGTAIPITVSQRNSTTLPPLPQRPQQLFNRPALGMSTPMFGGYSGFNSGYGSYGGYGASSYGGYGGMYGMGGYGYGSYPVGAGFENRFLQVAEESSRDAFQSIESIVRAFTSVSMMLESTYYAMYSSFRAVLGVVDNFSRLRQMFVQFLSTVTLLRIIRNFYRQLLHWLGVLDQNPQTERVWESVSGQAGEESIQQVAGSPTWPLITFVAFLFGGPYLISKLFSSSTGSTNQWDFTKGQYVKAAYPHQAGTQAELSFAPGEMLNLAPRELQTCEASGWLLAANSSGRTGYVPVTRLAAAKRPAATATAPAEEASNNQATESQSTESQ